MPERILHLHGLSGRNVSNIATVKHTSLLNFFPQVVILLSLNANCPAPVGEILTEVHLSEQIEYRIIGCSASPFNASCLLIPIKDSEPPLFIQLDPMQPLKIRTLLSSPELHQALSQAYSIVLALDNKRGVVGIRGEKDYLVEITSSKEHFEVVGYFNLPLESFPTRLVLDKKFNRVFALLSHKKEYPRTWIWEIKQDESLDPQETESGKLIGNRIAGVVARDIVMSMDHDYLLAYHPSKGRVHFLKLAPPDEWADISVEEISTQWAFPHKTRPLADYSWPVNPVASRLLGGSKRHLVFTSGAVGVKCRSDPAGKFKRNFAETSSPFVFQCNIDEGKRACLDPRIVITFSDIESLLCNRENDQPYSYWTLLAGTITEAGIRLLFGGNIDGEKEALKTLTLLSYPLSNVLP